MKKEKKTKKKKQKKAGKRTVSREYSNMMLIFTGLFVLMIGYLVYFQVVKSKTFGLLQHDPYTWLVTGNHLVRADHLYERRQQMDNNLNEWILSLNEQQLRTFVDTLYQVITASRADNLIDFTAEWKKSMNGVIAALKEVDEDTVEALKEIVRSLFEITRENRKKQVAAKAEAALERLAGRGKERKE